MICPNCVPINLLKILKHYTSYALTEFVSRSILKGTFPRKLKVAKVVAACTKGDQEIRCNYRPISLLPMLSKVFEKLVYKWLYSFVTRNNIAIYPLQFGFQENH